MIADATPRRRIRRGGIVRHCLSCSPDDRRAVVYLAHASTGERLRFDATPRPTDRVDADRAYTVFVPVGRKSAHVLPVDELPADVERPKWVIQLHVCPRGGR